MHLTVTEFVFDRHDSDITLDLGLCLTSHQVDISSSGQVINTTSQSTHCLMLTALLCCIDLRQLGMSQKMCQQVTQPV